VGEQDVTGSPDAFGDPLSSLLVDLGCRLEKHAARIHVRCADVGDAGVDKFVRSWSVLPVVSILDEEYLLLLKIRDGRGAPLTRHTRAP
jgi:hypothetical protein